jgi:hypothetical protein
LPSSSLCQAPRSRRLPPEPARELADALSLPPLALGVPVAVRLNRGQAAFFRLPENVGDIAALTRRLARDTDTVLALYDSHGRLLEEDDDGGDEMLASRIDISATQRGPLILRASLLDGGAGRFEVMLEAAPARAADAPPRTLAEAAGRPGLTVGEPLRLTLRGRQEAYVALPADAPDLIAVTRGLSPGTDTVLTLVDAMAVSSPPTTMAGEEQLASRLEIPAAQRRPLFLRIGTLGGGGGTFDVVIQPDAPAATPDLPSLDAGGDGRARAHRRSDGAAAPASRPVPRCSACRKATSPSSHATSAAASIPC